MLTVYISFVGSDTNQQDLPSN